MTVRAFVVFFLRLNNEKLEELNHIFVLIMLHVRGPNELITTLNRHNSDEQCPRKIYTFSNTILSFVYFNIVRFCETFITKFRIFFFRFPVSVVRQQHERMNAIENPMFKFIYGQKSVHECR